MCDGEFLAWKTYVSCKFVEMFMNLNCNIVIIEEFCLLGCGTVWDYYKPMFRSNVSPPSSE
jgi:hypothetical protein